MISDNIKNVDLYIGISKDIYSGLVFIKNATSSIILGNYKISPNVKVIVSEYTTVECFTRGYEAHKHVIDIQYPIVGLERVKWSPINNMEINIPYDPEKDRTFYKNPTQETYIDIGKGIFCIMFPDDGHSPKHFITEPELIKKITVKISI